MYKRQDIDNEVLYQFCRQVFLSLYRHGARKFVFLNGHGGNIKMIERLGMEFEDKGCLVAMLNWWLMAWDMNPAWKGGHGGGEETAAILGIDPSLVDKSEIGGELQFKHLSDNLKTTGFRSVEYKGVTVEIPRKTPHVTDNGWIGPDHPSTATEEWGKEMLETTLTGAIKQWYTTVRVDNSTQTTEQSTEQTTEQSSEQQADDQAAADQSSQATDQNAQNTADQNAQNAQNTDQAAQNTTDQSAQNAQLSLIHI